MQLSISGLTSVQPADRQAQTPAAAKLTVRPESSAGGATVSQSAHASVPAANQAPQPESSGDTVTLSQSAQVIQLSQQGQSPSQIAAELGIPVSTVNSDLGVTAAAVTSAPAAVPAASSPKSN